MIEPTLNRAYPSLSTLTSIIVQRAVKVMLDDGYNGKAEANALGLELLTGYVEVSFTLHEWEPDTTGPREQVMRELEFIGFAW